MSEVIVRVGETDNAEIKIPDAEVIKGKDGKDGQDGFSPVIFVETFSDGHNVRLIDKMHPGGQMFTVFNGTHGQKGEDGFSPVVTVEEIEGGHEVVITDAYGEHSFNVMDGIVLEDLLIEDENGNVWRFIAGAGEEGDFVIEDEEGHLWHAPSGAGGSGDIELEDGEGGVWHIPASNGGGGTLPEGGTDGQYLVKDSTAPGGARWADLPVYEPSEESWTVTPLVNAETTLNTAGRYLDRDVVVEAIPYAEVSNITGGLTATIGG